MSSSSLLADNIPDDRRARRVHGEDLVAEEERPRAPEPPPPAPAPSATAVGKTPKTRINFTPEAVALAEKRLASYVGPLARVLIKDAVGKSASLRELYTSLAAHIDDEEERRAFLAEFER